MIHMEVCGWELSIFITISIRRIDVFLNHVIIMGCINDDCMEFNGLLWIVSLWFELWSQNGGINGFP